MERKRAGAVRVGMGSHVYSFVGRWVPSGLVGWMMGLRRVGGKGMEFGRSAGSDAGGSAATSPGSSASGGGNVHGLGLGESEYISVYGEKEAEGDAA